VIVQLLRMLPRLDVAQGLVAESFAFALLQGSAEHRRWAEARDAAGHAEPPPAPGRVMTRRDGNVLEICIDRPWAGNAIDRPIRDGLTEAFELAALDSSITAVRLRGAGKVFSLGADLHEFGTTSDPATAHHIRQLTLPAAAAARCMDRLEVHVQGACVGSGLELACYARRLTAGPRAWFQLPELAMGILPGAGGCVSLTRRIGRQNTAAMILSGHRLTARQALSWGFIDAIVDDPAADEDGADIA
jgi:enoyl-CoA hydratase/carnithine racemase